MTLYTDIKGTPITHVWRITVLSPFALSYLWGEANVRIPTARPQQQASLLTVIMAGVDPASHLPTIQVYGWREDVWWWRRRISYPRRWRWAWSGLFTLLDFTAVSSVTDFQSILCGFKCVDLVHSTSRHCSASLRAYHQWLENWNQNLSFVKTEPKPIENGKSKTVTTLYGTHRRSQEFLLGALIRPQGLKFEAKGRERGKGSWGGAASPAPAARRSGGVL